MTDPRYPFMTHSEICAAERREEANEASRRAADAADEYEALAEECARRGIAPRFAIVIALRDLPMSETVREQITIDDGYFESRVRDYAYALAMDGVAVPEDES